mmetsp:Transcript_178487/g.571908  ORF Transcript_178487/g.571908 Transcript_178487/m.571908 type:complete len:221 (+) Transcript_178487:421-1083(+)
MGHAVGALPALLGLRIAPAPCAQQLQAHVVQLPLSLHEFVGEVALRRVQQGFLHGQHLLEEILLAPLRRVPLIHEHPDLIGHVLHSLLQLFVPAPQRGDALLALGLRRGLPCQVALELVGEDLGLVAFDLHLEPSGFRLNGALLRCGLQLPQFLQFLLHGLEFPLRLLVLLLLLLRLSSLLGEQRRRLPLVVPAPQRIDANPELLRTTPQGAADAGPTRG